jgi:2-methylisocitrate lyase-like PEP mutase family enzyme
VSRDEKIAHCKALAAACDLPINADLEKCFADDPAEAAQTIRLAAEAGMAGGSIEDATGYPDKPIYDFDHAVERVAAAAETARSLQPDFLLTARAENFLFGRKDLDDTIKRLQAFEAAGADVLYAPGLTTLEEVRAVTRAVSKPVNVLAPPLKGVRVAELAEAGAKRISIGGALARALIATLLKAGREMQDKGSFTWTAAATPANEIDLLMKVAG